MSKLIGLSDFKVKESRKQFGSNKLTEQESEGFLSKLKDNFNDPIMKILCVALFINIIFAYMGQASWYESVGIMIAIILATTLSTYSEMNNENAFKKLQEAASKIICKVMRGLEIKELSIDAIVKGDIVLLQAGDLVPADGVLIEGHIKVNQAALNGESVDASKISTNDSEVVQQNLDGANFVARGSVVTNDQAYIKVTAVGDHTIYGGIAQELQKNNDRESPLKVKLNKLADAISKFGYFGGIAIAFALLFQRIVIHNNFDIPTILDYCSNWVFVTNDLVHAVILAVIIIVMAVPEGLPLMIAIVSALNMRKMLKDNVLVRKIPGIETAGSLNILFSDKTGTITKGQLEAVLFVDANGKESAMQEALTSENLAGTLLKTNIITNTSAVKTSGKSIGGNMTERALLNSVDKKDIIPDPVEASIMFNSANKYSAVTLSEVTYIKGAPEKIIDRCTKYINGNTAMPLNDKTMILDKINELTSKAMRVLAFATMNAPIDKTTNILPEGEWTLTGVVGIRDDVRPEAVAAIKKVQDAGLQVVMITGDNKDTAVSIAIDAGLIKNNSDIILTSMELNQMSDKEVAETLEDLRVIARALPSDKSRLVRIAQSKNLVVGMTGDGVNDSPALKAADVGFGMGGGTEVAKEASDIVILDDNFKSIAKAILYGRTIYNNIRKFIQFQLTINVSAVAICLVCPFIGIDYPLSVTQILWVNLIMDTLAAIALGGEPALESYMKEKPKRRDENIINRYMIEAIGLIGCWTFLLSLLFLTQKGFTQQFADTNGLMTGYFALFVFCAVVNAFNTRTKSVFVFKDIKYNKAFIVVISMIVIVQVIMTYLGGDVLRCYGLTINQWILITKLALTVLALDIVRKVSLKNLD